MTTLASVLASMGLDELFRRGLLSAHDLAMALSRMPAYSDGRRKGRRRLGARFKWKRRAP